MMNKHELLKEKKRNLHDHKSSHSRLQCESQRKLLEECSRFLTAAAVFIKPDSIENVVTRGSALALIEKIEHELKKK